MKKILAFCLLVAAFGLQSCLKDKLTQTYTILTPVYKSKAEVYGNLRSGPSKAIQNPGKIYLYNNYIFLNELDKGVHIIDNSDPSNPVQKAFIEIPGNIDIAIKGSALYADLYTDLVTFDISDPLNAKVVNYIPLVFPERGYTNGFIPDSSRIVVDWVSKDTTVPLEQTGPIYYTAGVVMSQPFQNKAAAPGIIGIAGSMARFSIVDNYLYTINSISLTSYDISVPFSPQRAGTTNVSWNIETVYPVKDKMFVGSQSGMFVYDISDPTNLTNLGQFTHARSCDPVIADDDYAYVTLRNGSTCGGYTNELDVLNISDVLAPTIVKIYPLTNPRGLTKDGSLLFICDGVSGVKMYDASNPAGLKLKTVAGGFEANDVIAWNKRLIVTAADGLYQFGYADGEHLTQLSHLVVHH
ncbi:MAG TPA: hypothetical protein VGC95_02840 [Chitinophagaceae bacterium]